LTVFRDMVTRVSLPQIRAMFPPRVFASLESVRLEGEGYVVDVRVVQVPGPTVRGGIRRWLQCPRCHATTHVIGFAPNVGVGCRRCLGWRERRRVDVTGCGR
jgi:hypothetical protein